MEKEKYYRIEESENGNTKNDVIMTMQMAFIRYFESKGFAKGNPILHLQGHALAEVAFSALFREEIKR